MIGLFCHTRKTRGVYVIDASRNPSDGHPRRSKRWRAIAVPEEVFEKVKKASGGRPPHQLISSLIDGMETYLKYRAVKVVCKDMASVRASPAGWARRLGRLLGDPELVSFAMSLLRSTHSSKEVPELVVDKEECRKYGIG